MKCSTTKIGKRETALLEVFPNKINKRAQLGSHDLNSMRICDTHWKQKVSSVKKSLSN